MGANINLSARLSAHRIFPMGILLETFGRSNWNSLRIMVHHRTIRNVSLLLRNLLDVNFRPILNNSITPIKEFHLAKIVERLLKLSTVSLVAWLAGFFCFFHSTLNALAEIMYFADRKFYDAWWNSGSIGTYWRLWNLPVHTYFKRHVYIPLRRRGWKNTHASILVFTLSAIMHELLLGIPTHAVSPPPSRS